MDAAALPGRAAVSGGLGGFAPLAFAVVGAAGGLGVEDGALGDNFESVGFAEGVGEEGARVDFAEDAAVSVGVTLGVDGVEDLVHGDVGDGVVRGVAEDELATAATSFHDGDVSCYVDEDGRAVEAAAVRAVEVLKEELRVFLAAGWGRVVAAAAHAEVADVVAFGGSPDMIVLVLERNFGEFARVAVELAAEGD